MSTIESKSCHQINNTALITQQRKSFSSVLMLDAKYWFLFLVKRNTMQPKMKAKLYRIVARINVIICSASAITSWTLLIDKQISVEACTTQKGVNFNTKAFYRLKTILQQRSVEWSTFFYIVFFKSQLVFLVSFINIMNWVLVFQSHEFFRVYATPFDESSPIWARSYTREIWRAENSLPKKKKLKLRAQAACLL